MLLSFKAKNFKNFIDEMDFSMIPTPKQKGLDYSVMKHRGATKEYKGLCSSIVYGPNASGKTNIIGAMDVMRAVVLRGNIRNSSDKPTPNAASATLELIPNSYARKINPLELSIKFIEKDLVIQYDLKIDLGMFLDKEYSRKIVAETLHVNEKLIFDRNEELNFGSFDIIEEYLVNKFAENKSSMISIAKENLNFEELFLTGGFKTMFSAKLTALISNWFENKFTVIYHADSLVTTTKFTAPKKKAILIETPSNDAAKIFGINSHDIGYVFTEENPEPKLCSIFKAIAKNEKTAVVNAEIFESYGTIRFIHIFPIIIKALLHGGTLVIDEFDASIHPMAIMSIINAFHNDDINKRHAQLIFNTHNPIFLNSNLFRRDEIKFVERHDETGNSTLYSLADFGTSGEKGVRQHEDYMKNYFINRYGAIKNIDFSLVFEKLMNGENEV